MNKNWALIIDTTLQGAHVALVDISGEQSKLVHVSGCHDNRSSAAKLSVSVQKMLEIYDLNMSDITSICVANGPGTFTGIKIGISFASALTLANKNLKVVTVSALELFARSHSQSNLSFIPATKSQGYAAHFDGEKVSMYSLELREEEIVFKLDGTGKEKGLDDFNVKHMVTLKPWPNLESVVTSDIETIDLVHSTYRSIVAISQLVDWTQALVNKEIEPKYLRRSAPEEKLIKEGKLS